MTTPSHAPEFSVPETGLTIGFVGGVGSGKSSVVTAARRTLQEFGVTATILDGDRVGHETLLLPEVVDAIERAFGPEMIIDGQVCRKSLAGRVFGSDAKHRSARETLESIMHPAMRVTFIQRIAAAVKASKVVLFDAAILFESGWNDLCNACVFVDVPAQMREARAVSRGWSRDRWVQTEASQWTTDRKQQAVAAFGSCGLVVENTKPIAQVGEEVARWIVHELIPCLVVTPESETPVYHTTVNHSPDRHTTDSHTSGIQSTGAGEPPDVANGPGSQIIDHNTSAQPSPASINTANSVS